MNITEILNGETPNRCTKHLVALKPVKRFLTVSVGAFVALGATLGEYAQGSTVYSVNIVGCVPERTRYLLPAPYSDETILKVARQTVQIVETEMTPSERQLLYAQTFCNLTLVSLQTGENLNAFIADGPYSVLLASAQTGDPTDGNLNLNDIAAIGTRAETYVEGLSALIADEVVTTPFQEAIFGGLLTGAVAGLSNQ